MTITIKFKRSQISELTGESPSKSELERFNTTDLADLYDDFGTDLLELLDSNQLKDVLFALDIETQGDFDSDVQAISEALQSSDNKRKRDDDAGREAKRPRVDVDEYVPGDEDEESEDEDEGEEVDEDEIDEGPIPEEEEEEEIIEDDDEDEDEDE